MMDSHGRNQDFHTRDKGKAFPCWITKAILVDPIPLQEDARRKANSCQEASHRKVSQENPHKAQRRLWKRILV